MKTRETRPRSTAKTNLTSDPSNTRHIGKKDDVDSYKSHSGSEVQKYEMNEEDDSYKPYHLPKPEHKREPEVEASKAVVAASRTSSQSLQKTPTRLSYPRTTLRTIEKTPPRGFRSVL
jgi:hypothetical protein